MIWRFFSQDFHFFRGCKNFTNKKKKNFFDFLFKKKKKKKILQTVIPDNISSNQSKLDQNQSILGHFRPKNGHISKLGVFFRKGKNSEWYEFSTRRPPVGKYSN